MQLGANTQFHLDDTTMKQEQQEYQSTLSSAGAVETPGGVVTFTDIRPAYGGASWVLVHLY